MHIAATISITLLYALASTNLSANAIPGFNQKSLHLWQTEEFQGKTSYKLILENQSQILEAKSNNSASGLFFKKKLKLKPDSMLSWRWKVSGISPQLNETTKTGDDFPARVYIVVSEGPFFWQKRTLVYVWSNNQPVGNRWNNPFTDRAVMWAVNSGPEKTNTWQSHQRLLHKDLFTAFGKKYNEIEAIAVMTDSDNSGSQFLSWYGDISLKY